MTPSTVRTPPAGTFPLVSANVSSRMVVSNYYEHFSSTPRGLAMGVDASCLELSWNNSKPTPCLLVRPTYQTTSHHAGAAACVLNARAPLGVTHHTNERARETSTTAPPCPLATHSTRGMGRAIAHGAFFLSRVVVVVVSSAVVGRVFGSSTEEPNGGRRRGGKLKYPALGVCFYAPSVICPGPIHLCAAQNDQKGVRATTGELGIFLIWVFCRRPQFSRLISLAAPLSPHARLARPFLGCLSTPRLVLSSCVCVWPAAAWVLGGLPSAVCGRSNATDGGTADRAGLAARTLHSPIPIGAKNCVLPCAG